MTFIQQNIVYLLSLFIFLAFFFGLMLYYALFGKHKGRVAGCYLSTNVPPAMFKSKGFRQWILNDIYVRVILYEEYVNVLEITKTIQHEKAHLKGANERQAQEAEKDIDYSILIEVKKYCTKNGLRF